jgi:hypothetical protein
MFTVNTGSNLPENTNVLIGDIPGADFNFEIANFKPEDKVAYDEFFDVIGTHSSVVINNSPYEINAFRVIPENNIDPEIVEFDYSTMSLDDKAKIDAGAQALINAAESQQ